MSILDKLQVFINKLNETNSSKDKATVIKVFATKEILEMLEWVHNPYKLYNVTSKSLKKRSDIVASVCPDNVIELLRQLNDRELTGHSAIGAVNCFVTLNPQHEDLIYKIIDRNLETRVSAKAINKAFPNTIPSFAVALAEQFEKFEHKVDFFNDVWLGMRKLDGVRCVCIKIGDSVRFYSRKGIEFFTLGRLKDELIKIEGDVVLDGELCLIDENGDEDFTGIMKLLKKKDYTIENPCYKVFDILTLEDFDAGVSSTPYQERVTEIDHFIKDVFGYYGADNHCFETVPAQRIESNEHYLELLESALSQNWEGLILRKNIGYEGKRSQNLLKCKEMHDAEFEVLGIKSSEVRKIVDGQQVKTEMLSNVIIKHKGEIVEPSYGKMTMVEREYYHANPNELIGKTVTVQYFQESRDKNGKVSLRHPLVKHVYKDGRDC